MKFDCEYSERRRLTGRFPLGLPFRFLSSPSISFLLELLCWDSRDVLIEASHLSPKLCCSILEALQGEVIVQTQLS